MTKKILFILFCVFSSYTFGQMTTHSYDFEGISRSFNVYIPQGSKANNQKMPVVLFLHGMGGNVNNFSGFKYKADQEKFIMIIPQALNDPSADATWHSGAGTNEYYYNTAVNDVGFIASLIDTVSNWYSVDKNRVYSAGFSMGGFMSNRLACELDHKIAAIASVAGSLGNEIISTCKPKNAIATLHIHSQTDAVVPYANNQWGYDTDELIDFWVKHNNCDTNPQITNLSNRANDGFTSYKYLYKAGDLNSEVEFYKLNGPEHNESWYNATSNNDFDAIDVIWDFFERHQNNKPNTSTTSKQTIVTNIKNASFDVYPNPAVNEITINFKTPVMLSTIIISNTLGKTLETKYFDAPITKSAFDLKDKAPGIYFFQIKDIEGNLSVLRFYKK